VFGPRPFRERALLLLSRQTFARKSPRVDRRRNRDVRLRDAHRLLRHGATLERAVSNLAPRQGLDIIKHFFLVTDLLAFATGEFIWGSVIFAKMARRLHEWIHYGYSHFQAEILVEVLSRWLKFIDSSFTLLTNIGLT